MERSRVQSGSREACTRFPGGDTLAATRVGKAGGGPVVDHAKVSWNRCGGVMNRG